jgi:hypothetical protein
MGILGSIAKIAGSVIGAVTGGDKDSEVTHNTPVQPKTVSTQTGSEVTQDTVKDTATTGSEVSTQEGVGSTKSTQDVTGTADTKTSQVGTTESKTGTETESQTGSETTGLQTQESMTARNLVSLFDDDARAAMSALVTDLGERSATNNRFMDDVYQPYQSTIIDANTGIINTIAQNTSLSLEQNIKDLTTSDDLKQIFNESIKERGVDVGDMAGRFKAELDNIPSAETRIGQAVSAVEQQFGQAGAQVRRNLASQGRNISQATERDLAINKATAKAGAVGVAGEAARREKLDAFGNATGVFSDLQGAQSSQLTDQQQLTQQGVGLGAPIAGVTAPTNDAAAIQADLAKAAGTQVLGSTEGTTGTQNTADTQLSNVTSTGKQATNVSGVQTSDSNVASKTGQVTTGAVDTTQKTSGVVDTTQNQKTTEAQNLTTNTKNLEVTEAGAGVGSFPGLLGKEGVDGVGGQINPDVVSGLSPANKKALSDEQNKFSGGVGSDFGETLKNNNPGLYESIMSGGATLGDTLLGGSTFSDMITNKKTVNQDFVPNYAVPGTQTKKQSSDGTPSGRDITGSSGGFTGDKNEGGGFAQ